MENDPEVVTPIHGGMTAIFGCNVTTYEVEYIFFNKSIANAELSPANGSVTWLWNSVMGFSTTHLAEGFSVAANAATARGAASLWSRFYNEQATSIFAPVSEPRPNLQESSIQTGIVTKVGRGPLLALVASNILFAAVVLCIGVLALASDSAPVSAVARGLGIEGLFRRNSWSGHRAGVGAEGNRETMGFDANRNFAFSRDHVITLEELLIWQVWSFSKVTYDHDIRRFIEGRGNHAELIRR